MLVSVIIPVYNRENTIKAAVESVLAQTYQELEVVVVDDCSKDETVETVKSIKDARVRIITCEKNGGACVARNIGIRHAKGDVIAFQDSDDFWHVDKLEKSIDCMKREQAEFVFSALKREEIKNGKKNIEILPSYNLNEEKEPLARILYQNSVSTQTIVAKKQLFDKVEFDKSFPRFQDWDLAIRVIAQGYKVFYIDEPLVDCYVQADSITSDGKKLITAMKLLEKKYRKYFDQYPDSYRRFCDRSGYYVEMAGGNGTSYFKKSYALKKSFAAAMRYLLAKVRLYRPFNKMISKFIK